MSSLSRSNVNPNTAAGSPSFHEFKKQASFFFREKIKSARLALTDVTPSELLAKEAVSGNSPGSLNSPTLHRISSAAFEIGDFGRIDQVLHGRLASFDKRNWRVSYNSLTVLEYLLIHGPESIADEFQSDNVIALRGTFQYIDENGHIFFLLGNCGFNWGIAVKKKSERTLKLLEEGPLLREERDRLRKLKRGIQGFGNFCGLTPVSQGSPSPLAYGRCNSQFNPQSQEEVELTELENTDSGLVASNTACPDLFGSGGSLKENAKPIKVHDVEVQHKWSFFPVESKPLLVGKLDDCSNGLDCEDDHHFNDHQISHSQLAGGI